MSYKCKFPSLDRDGNHVMNEIDPDHYIEVYYGAAEESIFIKARKVDADLMSYSLVSNNGVITSYEEDPR